MYLIAGLGNPGDKYSGTRHNAGFLFVDYVADRFGLCFKDSKWDAELVKAELWGRQAVFVKPQTFMNRSGQSIGEIARFYRIPNEKIVVVHDELDLETGRIKIVVDRGAGGHNGIKSIIDHLGNNDFIRIRLGIGRPLPQMDVSSYVLSRFGKDELIALDEGLVETEKGLRIILEKGVVAAMNEVNSSR